MKTTVVNFFAALSVLGLIGVARAADEHEHEHKAEPVKEAVALIAPTKPSKSSVAGIVVLKQEKGYVQLTGEVTGLTPGKHGFHIHMFGDLRSADGMSVGGHYNPHGHPHGGPASKQRHEGDLGNLEATAEGVAKVNVKAGHVDLSHILGRSLVVHGDVDDLKSQPAGNAGPRIGIGVIGRAEVKATTAAKK
jgi:Cu-Zn family superoxide dismutase